MSRKMLVAIGVVVVLLLVVGAGGYVASRMAGQVHPAVTNNSATTNSSNPLFNVYTGSYTAVIKDQKAGASTATTTGTILVKDGSTYEFNGGSSQIIIDGSDYYVMEAAGKWLKYSGSQSGAASASAAFSSYLQNPALLALYAGASSTGSSSCSSVTCQTYTYTNASTKEQATIKVDSSSRLNELSSTAADGSQTTITYDYSTPVNITIPSGNQVVQAPSYP